MSPTLSREKRALNKAAEVLGGQAAFAAVLGYGDRRNVSPWFTTDRKFPAELCLVTERATRAVADERGDQSLVVTCEELRPDVAWDVLREQADASAPRKPSEHASANRGSDRQSNFRER